MTERKSDPTEDTADREIVITRVFDAPRKLVWEAWTDPKHVVHWWGPRGFTTTIQEMDVRPGGVWRHIMRGPDGTDYPNKSVFTEVVKPERIVYSHGGGKKGGPGAHFEATWTFDAQGDKTKVTIRMVFPSAADRDKVVKEYGAIEGGKQTLERLAEHLAKMSAADSEFVITRVFDAPRELVWKAWTESERLAKWWGPKGFTMLVGKLNLRPGGAFHYGMRAPTGQEMWGKFVYREIVAPERLVFTVSFSDEAGGLTRHPLAPNWPLEVLNVLTFAEHQGKTTVTITGIPINATELERKTFEDGHKSMQQGFTGTLDQLADYLAKA
ncbi:MAG: SRPBCC domain-containing protein [Acidobacteria bacterium]|nr:SRPBCC domain-containing protein [Acidobacteriota bacterium]